MAFSLLLGAALKGTLVLGAACVLAFALRRQSSAARHVVWTAAAAALLALPFLEASLPALRIAPPPAVATGVVFRVFASAAASGAASRPVRPLAPAWHPDVRFWISVAWLSGAALALLPVFIAYLRLWRSRRKAAPFPHELAIRVPVLAMSPGSMPATFGVLRPVILMPVDASEWSEERRRMVLLHELAHIERGDTATHLLGRVAFSLYWWNPLAWYAWRQSLKERERAADDLVLNSGERASDYAGHLLEIARSVRDCQATAWAAVPMARRSQLEGRLLAILDGRVKRGTVARAVPVAAALLAIAAIAPFAAIRAQTPDTQDGAALVNLATQAIEERRYADAEALYAKVAPPATARKRSPH
jgi:beta-lactamase regulating signal transducer with metallopeptidase domain